VGKILDSLENLFVSKPENNPSRLTRTVCQPFAAASVGFMDIGKGYFINLWEEGFK
tara:strand:- start:276 stop:443 length:168 start_codon:yes stop_codon:yes gene_type:complete